MFDKLGYAPCVTPPLRFHIMWHHATIGQTSSPKFCKELLFAVSGICSCANWKLYNNFLLDVTHVQVVGACPNSDHIWAEFCSAPFHFMGGKGQRAAWPPANRLAPCWHPAGTLLAPWKAPRWGARLFKCEILSLIMNKGIKYKLCSCY